MNKNKPLQVVMLGAGLNCMGGISSVEKLILEQGIPEFHLKHIATIENGSMVKKSLVFLKAIVNFSRTLLTKEVDLIHIHFCSRGSTFRTTILIVISFFFRIPIVLHAHGAGFEIFYGNLPLLIQRNVSYLFCHCSHFIALSESWKKFYTTNLGLEEDKTIVLPNPVKFPLQTKDSQNHNPNTEDSNTINFLFLGRIGKRKGTFELIKAFSLISSQQRSRASLTIAGDGDLENAHALIKDLDLTNRIVVHDWVNSEERDALLAKSDVFVLPSYNEGLPMAVLEAMSFGLPVVTTPVGGIPELISHGTEGLLIDPGNIQELSSAMQTLIKDEDMRNSLGAKARERVASLDIQKYCLTLMSIYKDVVKDIK